jgi:hypothetical protein
MGKLVKTNPSWPVWLIAGCLLHAILITVEWLLEFKLDLDFLPGKIWLGFALPWPLWFIGAFASPRPMRKKWVVAAAFGVLILTPTISTIYTYIGWAIGGFAP